MMASSSSIVVTWFGIALRKKLRLGEVENKFGVGRDQPQLETAPRAASIYETFSNLHFEYGSGMSSRHDKWRLC
jgi:hypothetical protein